MKKLDEFVHIRRVQIFFHPEGEKYACLLTVTSPPTARRWGGYGNGDALEVCTIHAMNFKTTGKSRQLRGTSF